MTEEIEERAAGYKMRYWVSFLHPLAKHFHLRQRAFLKSWLKSATGSFLNKVMVRFVVIAFRLVSCIKCCSCVSTLHPMAVKFADNPCEMSWNMEIQKLMQSNEWNGFLSVTTNDDLATTGPCLWRDWSNDTPVFFFRENHNNTEHCILCLNKHKTKQHF